MPERTWHRGAIFSLYSPVLALGGLRVNGFFIFSKFLTVNILFW
jgi:hypothetical protein